MPFTQGQILENADDKRKVLGVCGELYFLSNSNDFNAASGEYNTEQKLIKYGYKPVAEKWKPEVGKRFWYIDTFGEPTWDVYRDVHEFAVLVGNCFPLNGDGLKQAREYRQWLLDNPYPQGK